MLRRLEPGSYFGATTPLYGLDGLTVVETAYPPLFVIPAHEHTNAFFCFVLAGRGTRTWRGRSGAEAPMALTLFPAGHEHANCWHDTGGRALHVEFAPRWLERLRGQTKILDRPSDFDRGPPVWLARRLANECAQHDDVTPLVIEALALELLAACSRAATHDFAHHSPPWLNRVIELLRARFTEDLSLADLAAVAGVSADHLARAFRVCNGCTVGDHVRRLRVEFACDEIVASDAPLADVALAAGFTDQSHLTKVFRRHTGMTPAAFRTLHRARRSHTRR